MAGPVRCSAARQSQRRNEGSRSGFLSHRVHPFVSWRARPDGTCSLRMEGEPPASPSILRDAWTDRQDVQSQSRYASNVYPALHAMTMRPSCNQPGSPEECSVGSTLELTLPLCVGRGRVSQAKCASSPRTVPSSTRFIGSASSAVALVGHRSGNDVACGRVARGVCHSSATTRPRRSPFCRQLHLEGATKYPCTCSDKRDPYPIIRRSRFQTRGEGVPIG